MFETAPPLARTIDVGLAQVTVHSDSTALLEQLADYYQGFAQGSDHHFSIWAWQRPEFSLPELDWEPVPREPGKTGKKEQSATSPLGHWIQKVRTGMHFLQRDESPVAVGPCEQNLPQIVNFINNQLINHYIDAGYCLGHASGFTRNKSTLAIAASSGGGKSTLMLRCLENPANHFLSNDRVLFKDGQIVGIPKWPRVNPGTLLHSDRLKGILPTDRAAELGQLSQTELWVIEEKYDVLIPDHYGPERATSQARFEHLVMLNWSLDSSDPLQLTALTEKDGIEGLRKRPGPFYIKGPQPAPAAELGGYWSELSQVNVWELTGKIDFDAGAELLDRLL